MWTFVPEPQRIDIPVSLLVDLHMATAGLSSTTTFMVMNTLGLYLLPIRLPFCEGSGNARAGLIPGGGLAGGLPLR